MSKQVLHKTSVGFICTFHFLKAIMREIDSCKHILRLVPVPSFRNPSRNVAPRQSRTSSHISQFIQLPSPAETFLNIGIDKEEVFLSHAIFSRCSYTNSSVVRALPRKRWHLASLSTIFAIRARALFPLAL